MSHLSTIISRVKHRLDTVYKGDIKKASKDSLFKQAVNNLEEYIRDWDDFTKEALELGVWQSLCDQAGIADCLNPDLEIELTVVLARNIGVSSKEVA